MLKELFSERKNAILVTNDLILVSGQNKCVLLWQE